MNAVRAEIGKLLTLPSLWITASLTLAVTLLLRVLGLPGSVLAHTQAGLLVFGVLAAGRPVRRTAAQPVAAASA